MSAKIITFFALMFSLATNLFPQQSQGALLVVSAFDKSSACGPDDCFNIGILACVIVFPLLPLCLLDAQGGTPAISDEFLNENGYTQEQVATIRGDLDVLSKRLKERGATLKLENNDTIGSLTNALRNLDPEVAPITAEVIWQVMH